MEGKNLVENYNQRNSFNFLSYSLTLSWLLFTLWDIKTICCVSKDCFYKRYENVGYSQTCTWNSCGDIKKTGAHSTLLSDNTKIKKEIFGVIENLEHPTNLVNLTLTCNKKELGKGNNIYSKVFPPQKSITNLKDVTEENIDTKELPSDPSYLNRKFQNLNSKELDSFLLDNETLPFEIIITAIKEDNQSTCTYKNLLNLFARVPLWIKNNLPRLFSEIRNYISKSLHTWIQGIKVIEWCRNFRSTLNKIDAKSVYLDKFFTIPFGKNSEIFFIDFELRSQVSRICYSMKECLVNFSQQFKNSNFFDYIATHLTIKQSHFDWLSSFFNWKMNPSKINDIITLQESSKNFKSSFSIYETTSQFLVQLKNHQSFNRKLYSEALSTFFSTLYPGIKDIIFQYSSIEYFLFFFILISFFAICLMKYFYSPHTFNSNPKIRFTFYLLTTLHIMINLILYLIVRNVSLTLDSTNFTISHCFDSTNCVNHHRIIQFVFLNSTLLLIIITYLSPKKPASIKSGEVIPPARRYVSNFYENSLDYRNDQILNTKYELSQLKGLLQDEQTLAHYTKLVKSPNLEDFARGFYPGIPSASSFPEVENDYNVSLCYDQHL